jgi:hypothetical protein
LVRGSAAQHRCRSQPVVHLPEQATCSHWEFSDNEGHGGDMHRVHESRHGPAGVRHGSNTGVQHSRRGDIGVLLGEQHGASLHGQRSGVGAGALCCGVRATRGVCAQHCNRGMHPLLATHCLCAACKAALSVIWMCAAHLQELEALLPLVEEASWFEKKRSAMDTGTPSSVPKKGTGTPSAMPKKGSSAPPTSTGSKKGRDTLLYKEKTHDQEYFWLVTWSLGWPGIDQSDLWTGRGSH